MDIKNYIHDFQDFPKKGIIFRDISPLLGSPEALEYVINQLVKESEGADVIIGMDARGFLFGTMVASRLQKPFVMMRKKGKLPGITFEKSYGLEYGNDILEIQKKSIKPGQKVAIIDDLLATGGTLIAALDLLSQIGGKVHNISFVIALNDEALVKLESRKYLEQFHPTSIVQY